LTLSSNSIHAIAELDKQREKIRLIRESVTRRGKETIKGQSRTQRREKEAKKDGADLTISDDDVDFIEIDSDDCDGDDVTLPSTDSDGLSSLQSFVFQRTKELNEYTQQHPTDIEGYGERNRQQREREERILV
jgi:hypothetical protein